MAVIPLPPAIINHLGKITLGATVTALGGLAYAQRERISRWLDSADLDISPRARDEVLRDLPIKLPPGEREKLASLNANAVAELKGLINDVHEELGSMAENIQELREAMASLKARQDTVEAVVRGKPCEERASDGNGELPASPAPRQAAGRTAALGGKRRGNGPAGPDSRPA
ncbi:hypothetical protein [Myxococcus sp. Y35]|uniref:hypothetical protein n=1 Tax=Pseudomyxococcus flavus TaxID=3115648 RepID=UPI003CF3EE23